MTNKILDNKELLIQDLEYNLFIPKHPKRKNIYVKFFNLLSLYYNIFNDNDNDYKYDFPLDDLQKKSLNIEKSIFNYTLINHSAQDWNNMFQFYYIQSCVRVFSNLHPSGYLGNINLLHKLFQDKFKAEDIAFLDSSELFTERHDEIMQVYKKSLGPELVPVKIEDLPDGMHKCGNCMSKKQPAYKTTHYQLQTRSADEPLTTFVACANCQKRWRY